MPARKKVNVARAVRIIPAQKRSLQGRGAYTPPAPRYEKGESLNAINKKNGRKFGKSAGAAVRLITGLIPGVPGSISNMLGSGAEWLGQKFGSLMGWGDYRVSKNTLMMGMDPPNMHTSSGDAIITHREFIADIQSSGVTNTFNLQSFAINPGLEASFPWLAGLADAYEEYELMGCVYEFKSTSSDALNSTNTALGYVVMATNYNSASPTFANKLQMENTQYTNSAKPSLSFVHPIECDPALQPMKSQYIRTGAVPAGQDQKTYDLGLFQIASGGMQGVNVAIGELWVTYQVALRKPIFAPQQTSAIATDHFQLSVVSGGVPMGTSQAPAVANSIGGSITINTTYNFPVSVSSGDYMVVYFDVGTLATITIPSVSGVNCTFRTLWTGDTVQGVDAPQAGQVGTTKYYKGFICRVNAPGGAFASFTFGTAGTIPTAGTGDLWVMQINANIITLAESDAATIPKPPPGWYWCDPCFALHPAGRICRHSDLGQNQLLNSPSSTQSTLTESTMVTTRHREEVEHLKKQLELFRTTKSKE